VESNPCSPCKRRAQSQHCRHVHESKYLVFQGAGIAQCYSVGLRVGWSGVRVPAGNGSFFHHRVQNLSGAHSASYPMGTSQGMVTFTFYAWYSSGVQYDCHSEAADLQEYCLDVTDYFDCSVPIVRIRQVRFHPYPCFQVETKCPYLLDLEWSWSIVSPQNKYRFLKPETETARLRNVIGFFVSFSFGTL
jgi:hypothetical protein